MDVISSDQWPQIDEKSCMLMASTMEKSSSHQQQQQPLKCPRCDSSNTKFCYYNNYSLTQPRHFCKACKRYWTRGGTLRNVPVGGGCRKNKRNSGLKRPISSVNEQPSTHHPPPLPAPPNPKPPSSTQIRVSSSSSSSSDRVINPIFYGVPSDHHSMNLPLIPGRFMNSRVLDGFDMNLGFNGFNNQEIVASNPLLSSYNSMFNNSNLSSTTTSPTLATLLASTFHQQKFNNNVKDANSNHQIQDQLAPFGDLQMVKDQVVKLEHGESTGFDWSNNMQSHIDQINHHQFTADPSIYSNNWNPNSSVNAGTWHDPSSNIGSSVTSLI